MQKRPAAKFEHAKVDSTWNALIDRGSAFKYCGILDALGVAWEVFYGLAPPDQMTSWAKFFAVSRTQGFSPCPRSTRAREQ